MTKNPVTVSQDTSVERAARLMLEHKIGGLPVMSGGTLVGMITVTDVLWAFLELSEGKEVDGENEASTRGTVASRRA